MDTQARSDVGPIVAADQRTSTDPIFFIFLVVYLVFWFIMGIIVLTHTPHEIGIADADDDSVMSFTNADNGVEDKIKEIIDFEPNDRVTHDLMRFSMKRTYDKSLKDGSSTFNIIQEIIIFTIVAIIFVAVVVILSFIAVYVIKTHPRIALGISIFCIYFSMIYDVLDSFLKLLSALKLHHPNPIDHVAFLAYDLGCFVIVIFVTIVFFKKLVVVAAIIREGSKAATSLPYWIFFYPVVKALFENLVEIVFGIVANSVLLIKDSTRDRFQGHIWFCQFYNLFGYFWLSSLVAAMARIIISRTVAIYYWSDNSVKHLIPRNVLTESWNIALQIHRGTAAFGSGISATAKWMRAALKILRTNVESKGFYLNLPVFDSFNFLFECLVAVVMYINKNAYIMCAVHGTNFINSAKQAIELIYKNLPLALITNWLVIWVVRVFLSLVAIIPVTIGTLIWGFTIDADTMVVVAFFLWSVASAVINIIFFVVQVATDTVLLSALEDFDRNNGSSATDELKNAMSNS